MRKPIAVILLFTFLAAQYARQVSYLECKLVNYFSGSAIKCDCEKLLSVANDASSTQPPVAHNHLHLDEWYSIAQHYHEILIAPAHSRYWPVMPVAAIIDDTGGPPDRPPRLM